MTDSLLNQTMYDVFFSAIGILMGFFQVEFFQLSLETNEDKKKDLNYKFIYWAVFIIQELLLCRFFISLLYIYYYGTYVARGTCKNLESSIIFIKNLESFGNGIILFFIWALITINLILALRQSGLLRDKKKIIITLFISTCLFLFILCCIIETETVKFRELPWESFPTPTCPPTPTPKS